MKKTEIIKKNYEFKYFFKKGKYFSGTFLEVFIFENNNIKNKIGIVVSKKVGGSVERNRLKRYIREAYSSIEEDIKPNVNMLILWKKNVSCTLANFFDTKNDLINILKRAGNVRRN